MIVTIDGPTVSGKSTVARALANKLGFYCLSSGLLYRALAYILLYKFGYKPDELYTPLPEDIQSATDSDRFVYTYDKTQCGTVMFDGEDITSNLKKTEVAHCASVLGTNIVVRDKLRHVQHELAKKHDMIVEGRDSGSVIFPDADVKFYLTAPIEVRAQRWQADKKRHETIFSLQEAISVISERDQRDKERKIAPLVIPNGAIIIDSATMNLEQTVKGMLDHIKK